MDRGRSQGGLCHFPNWDRNARNFSYITWKEFTNDLIIEFDAINWFDVTLALELLHSSITKLNTNIVEHDVNLSSENRSGKGYKPSQLHSTEHQSVRHIVLP